MTAIDVTHQAAASPARVINPSKVREVRVWRRLSNAAFWDRPTSR